MSMKNEPLTTVKELVTHFGGPTAVGRWLDVVPSAVSNWIAHDSIPRGHHLLFFLRVQHEGIDVDPRVFHLASFEAVGLHDRNVA